MMSDKSSENEFDFLDAERQMIFSELEHFSAISKAVRQRVSEDASPDEIRDAMESLLDDESLREDFESLAAAMKSRESGFSGESRVS